jgi:integrase
MSVEQTQYGTWRARWRDIDGTPRAKSFRTRSLAEKHERRMRTDTEDGKPTAPRRRQSLSLRAWADQWLDSSHNLRQGARDLYREDLDRYIIPALGDVDIRTLENRPELIDEFLAAQLAKGRAPASVHRYWRTLRRMLNVAVRRSKIQRSPMLDVEPPRVPKEEMLFLEAGELERLADAANEEELRDPDSQRDGPAEWDYGPLILTAGWGGLRWGECSELRRRHVDQNRGGIYVSWQWTGEAMEDTKGSGDRFVALPPSVMERLPVGGDPAALVFTMPRGGRLNHSNWRQRVWVPAKRHAKVDARLRFQDLRHTAVALAIKAGTHPEAIKRRFGWSTIALIDVYGHLLADVEPAVADRLEEIRSEARTPNLRAV